MRDRERERVRERERQRDRERHDDQETLLLNEIDRQTDKNKVIEKLSISVQSSFREKNTKVGYVDKK